MKEVIFGRGHAIEEEHTITATVLAARAAIDSGNDVKLIYRGNESAFTLRHALDKYDGYSVSQRISELRARLIELYDERDSILKEIDAETEYLSKAQKLVSSRT